MTCDPMDELVAVSEEAGLYRPAVTDADIDAFVDAYFTAPGSDPREPGSGLLSEEGVRRGLAAAARAAPTVTDDAADALCKYREHVAPEPNDMTSSGISWREGSCLCHHDAAVVLEAAARARQENRDG